MADDRDLSSILAGDATPVKAPTPQEATAAALQLAVLSNEGQPVSPSRWVFRAEDPHEWVAQMVRAHAGRRLWNCPVWVRVHDGKIGLLAVLHAHSEREMELLLVGNRGTIDRTTMRFLARWAFEQVCGEGLRRVVVRIPSGADLLMDLARRAGFRHEGTAHGYFGEHDASLWAMTRSDLARCRWWRSRSDAAPADTASFTSSSRVH